MENIYMLKQFLKEEKGQTTVEYLLIIAVIVVVITVLGKGMKDNIGKVVDSVFAGVQQKIKVLMSAANQ
jgi:Flp pilus assembly pilin Flp